MTVYFAKAIATGQIKIGYVQTESAERPPPQLATRLRQIRAVFRVELELVAYTPGGRQVESWFHKRHADAVVDLEWFRPSSMLLEDIAALASGAKIEDQPEPPASIPPRAPAPVMRSPAPKKEPTPREYYLGAIVCMMSGLCENKTDGWRLHKAMLRVCEIANRCAFHGEEIPTVEESREWARLNLWSKEAEAAAASSHRDRYRCHVVREIGAAS